MPAYLFSWSFGALTQAAGTPIVRVAPPRKNRYTRVSTLGYTCGATQHVISFLTVLDTVATAQAYASGATAIKLSAAPTTKTPVAGDYVTVQFSDRSTFTTTVASWNAGTLTVTLSAGVTDSTPGNSTLGLAAGANVWFHGQASDHTANETLNALISGYRSYTADVSVGLVTSKNFNEPIVVYSPNTTNAGVLEQVAGLFPAK